MLIDAITTMPAVTHSVDILETFSRIGSFGGLVAALEVVFLSGR